jgi:hypothetical protein
LPHGAVVSDHVKSAPKAADGSSLAAAEPYDDH